MIFREEKIRIGETENGKERPGREPAVLSCYIKENTNGKPEAVRKAVIICPGGCYEFCSTREAEPVAFQFLAMDLQAFVLRYSAAPSPFPQALLELAESVAFVREHAGEWHIDPERILVCGFSAGGHLAASLGTFWNRDFLSAALKRPAEQLRPAGLILGYPVISAGKYAHTLSFDHLTAQDTVCSREALSLEKQAGPQIPPVFLWHTDQDRTVPVENSLLFAMALKEAGVSLELHIFPAGRHGLALANEETEKVFEDGRGTYLVPACQAWIPLVKQWLSRLFIDFPIDS